MEPSELSRLVKGLGVEYRFDLIGVASADELLTEEVARLKQVGADGYLADMDYLTDRPERRADPSLLLPNCQSVIVIGINYNRKVPASINEGEGRIARYAINRDYHKVIKQRLSDFVQQLQTAIPDSPNVGFKIYVDTGPVMEKVWGAKAGLGFKGRSGLLVSPKIGTFFHLAVILTTLKIEPDKPVAHISCGNCHRCVDACPTQALMGDGRVNAGKCLTYHNVESSNPIPPDIETKFTEYLFGCDICQVVCPYNIRFGQPVNDNSMFGKPVLPPVVDLQEILAMNDAGWSKFVAGSSLKRSSLERMKMVAGLIGKKQK